MKGSRAAGARDVGGGAVSALPDHLLELCMPRSGEYWYTPGWRLTTLRLVCKRWRRVYDSSPRMTPSKWVVSHTWHLSRGDGASAATPDIAALPCMAACRAAVVQTAQFEEVHKAGRLEAVQQLTALTSLSLTADSDDGCQRPQPGQELAQRQLGLGALPRLRELVLSVDCLLGPSCSQLSAARHLTSLNVSGFLYEVPSVLWEAVACMPALAELEVGVHTCSDSTTVINSHAWDCLAACTQLARLKLVEHCITAGADDAGCFGLLAGTTRLTSLRHLQIEGSIASLGDLWQHTGLTRLVLLDGCERFPQPPPGTASSLPALRVANVACTSLELTALWDGMLSSALRHVTHLILRSSVVDWGFGAGENDNDAVFEQLPSLLQMEALHTLKLAGTLHSVPDTVRGLTSLKLLDVSGCRLSELPEGPYLLGLRTLLMQGHDMQRLPPALATARSLEELDATPYGTYWLPDFKLASPMLLLQPSDLTLLAALPALRLLRLPLSEKMFPADDPEQQVATARQQLLATAFCALFPQLAVASYGVADLPRISQLQWRPDGAVYFSGSIHPALLAKLQACSKLSWAALGQERQQQALALLRQAADAGELSHRAMALLRAFAPQPGGQSG